MPKDGADIMTRAALHLDNGFMIPAHSPKDAEMAQTQAGFVPQLGLMKSGLSLPTCRPYAPEEVLWRHCSTPLLLLHAVDLSAHLDNGLVVLACILQLLPPLIAFPPALVLCQLHLLLSTTVMSHTTGPNIQAPFLHQLHLLLSTRVPS